MNKEIDYEYEEEIKAINEQIRTLIKRKNELHDKHSAYYILIVRCDGESDHIPLGKITHAQAKTRQYQEIDTGHYDEVIIKEVTEELFYLYKDLLLISQADEILMSCRSSKIKTIRDELSKCGYSMTEEICTLNHLY